MQPRLKKHWFKVIDFLLMGQRVDVVIFVFGIKKKSQPTWLGKKGRSQW